MKFMLVIWILTFSVILSGQGVPPPGLGTESDPYLMSELDHLVWLSETEEAWNSHFLQTNDIDATDTENWNDGHGFEPIGSMYYDFGWVYEPFTGYYDGASFSISDLYINNPVSLESCLGLFRMIENATVENLILNNFIIDGQSTIGLLCGRMVNCEVDNVIVSGDLTVADGWVGGLVARVSNSVISSCITDVNIVILNQNSSDSMDIGGFAGILSENSQVIDCQSTLNFYSANDVEYLGGFVGHISESIIINNCSSSATISCDGSSIGGFVGSCYGKIFNSSCIIEYEHIETPSQEIGGFVGSLQGTDITWPEYLWFFPEINSCSTTGSIGGWNDVGGFLGFGSNFILKDCYTKTDVTAYQYDNSIHILDPRNIGTFAGDIIIESFPPPIIIGAFTSYSANTIYLVPESIADDFIYAMHGGGYFMGYGCCLDYELLGVPLEDIQGSFAYSSEEMKDVEIYTNNDQSIIWDFVGNPFEDNQNNDYWNIDSSINDGYPFLTNNYEIPVSNDDIEQVVVVKTDIIINSLYPNPFNPTTAISYTLNKRSSVVFSVYNIKGQRVYSKRLGILNAGNHKLTWNGVNMNNTNVASGMYLFKIKTESQGCLTKGILIK